MHNRALILYDDPAHQAHALHDQPLLRAGDGGRLLIGFVNERAKKADAFHGDQPRFRNFDFAATHEGHGLDRGRIAFHIRLAQVNLKSAHHGQDAAAFEVLAGDAAFEAAENCHTVEISVRGTDLAPAIEYLWPLSPGSAIGTDARAGSLPDHVKADVRDAEIFQNQQPADRQQADSPYAAPAAAAAINQHRSPGGNQHHRPEIAEHAVGVDQALLVEQEHHAGGDDQRAEDEAPTVGPVASHDC